MWCGCQFGWEPVVAEIRKILKSLPLTAANITACSDALIEGYGAAPSRVIPPSPDLSTPDRPTTAPSPPAPESPVAMSVPSSVEATASQEITANMKELLEQQSASYEQLKAQLAQLKEEVALDEMGVAHAEYKRKVEGMLDSVQARKAQVVESYEAKVAALHVPGPGSDVAQVRAAEEARRVAISALQADCERELAQAHAYEARVLAELEEVSAVQVRGSDLTQEQVDQKHAYVAFLAEALEKQEAFVTTRVGEIQGQLGMIQQARQSERVAEAEARGLVLSYEEQLQREKLAAQEAKSAYISEAQLLEQSEATAASASSRIRDLEEMVKDLEKGLTSERSARAVAELKAAAATRAGA